MDSRNVRRRIRFQWVIRLEICPAARPDEHAAVRAHPHPFHLISWALFFGPIIILVPSLVILEIVILFLFNLSFMSHGLFAGTSIDPGLSLVINVNFLGSVEERFHVLREYFMDTRESLFATVEHWTAVLNTWTMKYPPLLLLRLIAGMLGLFVFIGLWSGW